VPKVQEIPAKLEKSWGTGTFVIPAPTEVDALMRKVPAGKVTTINDIRAALAKKHGTTVACPITTGIFARIAAGAAEERKQKGETDITPYWRMLKVGGVINEKYPGGMEAQAKLLEKEGHVVVRKGKTCRVQNYEKALAKL
jgi:alkylated DNA nucleotide flippase Atl1